MRDGLIRNNTAAVGGGLANLGNTYFNPSSDSHNGALVGRRDGYFELHQVSTQLSRLPRLALHIHSQAL